MSIETILNFSIAELKYDSEHNSNSPTLEFHKMVNFKDLNTL